MNRSGMIGFGALIWSLFGPGRLSGQVLSLAAGPAASSCGSGHLSARLRSAHPLGASRTPARQCLDETLTWVPTAPLDPGQREVWRRALRALEASDRTGCQEAARVLDQLERDGRVSVWSAVDTVGGMLYLGAAYVDHDAAPLAVQFWAPALDRPLGWFVGAAAHEAFHVLQPGGSEDEAHGFGATCGGAVAARAVRTTGGGGGR
ncbi:MAG: hypothetical protein ACKVZ0_04810 [Gemmatimonadales bacterium]